MRSNLHAKSLGILAILLLAASLASAQVVTVNPVAGNTTASGTALRNALAGITDASSTKPYVIRVSPGTYDLGATGITMKPYVDIEGSGQQTTVIRGSGNNTSSSTAVVKGAFPAELRNLEVASLGQTFTYSVAVLLTAPTTLRNVTLFSSSATNNWGLRSVSTDSTLENVTVTLVNGTTSYGIDNTGTGGLAPTIRRAVITMTGATTSYGIHSDQTAAPIIRDADIYVSASAGAYGIAYDRTGFVTGAILEVTNAKVVATGTSVGGFGVDFNGHDQLVLTHSNIQGSSVGVRNNSPGTSGLIVVDQCNIKGTTNSVLASMQTAQIGASKLDGPANIAFPTCAASFNGNYVPLSASCL
jgi:hypothetical protein